ncbi:lipoprotein signal peptidase [Flavobacterium cheonanense]|uniref:Lipoprotein signal peptidase n=1 Tax=Flavobacterium cheonanense TaxID=706183 RepID=A0ABP7VHF7_9FLAO
MKLRHAALIIILILIVDQFSKVYVKTNFYYGESYPVLSWFNITFIENEGMAWGTKIPGEYGKLFLTLFRILAVGGIAYWLWDSIEKEKSKFLITSISLIFAGALGNIIDSVLYGVMFEESTRYHLAKYFSGEHYGEWFHGRVVDMFEFPIWEGKLPNWIPVWGGNDFRFFNAIFNVADFAISVGVGILIFFNKRAFALAKLPPNVKFSNKLDDDAI